MGGEQFAFPLSERFGVSLLGRRTGAAGHEAVSNGVGDHAGEECYGADSVVVTRDRVVDLVWVAVRVEDGHNGDVELACLGNRKVFLLGVNDPHSGRRAGHVTNTTERLRELVAFAALHEEFLLGEGRACHVVEVNAFEFLQTSEAARHGLEVGEHPAEPALVNEGHANAGCLLGDRFLGLLLRANEQDFAAACNGVLDEVVRAIDLLEGLLKVNDVDAVAFRHDETLHLRVPPAGLMPEVDTAFEQLAHGYYSHGVNPFARRKFLRRWCTRVSRHRFSVT